MCERSISSSAVVQPVVWLDGQVGRAVDMRGCTNTFVPGDGEKKKDLNDCWLFFGVFFACLLEVYHPPYSLEGGD